tara:strand:+ start:293 stop:466 length:174 start_codon:yes stop_codon:yes gene_type:complete
MNQLLSNIEVSLLKIENELISLLLGLLKTKNTNKEIEIKMNKKDKINKPLSGSLANV